MAVPKSLQYMILALDETTVNDVNELVKYVRELENLVPEKPLPEIVVERQVLTFALAHLARFHEKYKGCGISPIIWGIAYGVKKGIGVSDKGYAACLKHMNYNRAKYNELLDDLLGETETQRTA